MNIQANLNTGNGQLNVPVSLKSDKTTEYSGDTAVSKESGDRLVNQESNALEVQEKKGLTSVAKSAQEEDENSKSVSMDVLEKVAEEVEKELKGLNSRIAVKIDKDTETPVVQVIDSDTGEVIRQMPPEDMLKLRASFQEMLRGLFVDKEA